MAATGIYKTERGWQVDKVVLGVRLRRHFPKVGDAKNWLAIQTARIIQPHSHSEAPEILFKEAAARYLKELTDMNKPSAISTSYHLQALMPYIGDLELSKISDSSFDKFRSDKAALGQKPKTIRLSLDAANATLNSAAKKWIVPGTSMTYLRQVPYIQKPKLAGQQRAPRPISWDEQDTLLRELPDHLRDMSMFITNTGVRDSVATNLRWEWILEVNDLNTYVFDVPKEYVKGRQQNRFIILNSEAKKIIEAQRGKHKEFVFCWRRERVKNFDAAPVMSYGPVQTMNNTAWQSARKRAGLGDLHVHDLRHTFAMRLHGAGVSEAVVASLLWHTNGSVTRHYMGSQLRQMEAAVELIAHRRVGEGDDISLDALRAAKELRAKRGAGGQQP
jgi:integrase